MADQNESPPKRRDQIVELATTGKTDKEIATTLGISVHTVTQYWRDLKKIHGVSGRTALVVKHLKEGMEAANAQLTRANNELRERTANHIVELEKSFRREEALEDELDLFKVGARCSRSFTYRVLTTRPFRCKAISDSASLFGLNPQDLISNSKSWFDVVHPSDGESLMELLDGQPYRADVRSTYLYRLKENDCWIIDVHQCLIDESGEICQFAGCATDASPLIEHDLLTPKVARICEVVTPISITSRDKLGGFGLAGSPI